LIAHVYREVTFFPRRPVFRHETVNFEHPGGFFRLAEKNGPPYIPRIGLNGMMFRHLEVKPSIRGLPRECRLPGPGSLLRGEK
jgi:hypothetical protein